MIYFLDQTGSDLEPQKRSSLGRLEKAHIPNLLIVLHSGTRLYLRCTRDMPSTTFLGYRRNLANGKSQNTLIYPSYKWVTVKFLPNNL